MSLSIWDSQKHSKIVVVNGSLNVLSQIPDAKHIGTTSFKANSGQMIGLLTVSDPSTEKSYRLKINSSGEIYTWGVIPAMSNATVTGAYMSI